MIQAFEDFANSENWCDSAKMRFRSGPKNPIEYYSRISDRFRAWEWMHALETLNPPKAQALLLQSIQELLDDGLLNKADSETLGWLQSVANGTVDYNAMDFWYQNTRRHDNLSKMIKNIILYFKDGKREAKRAIAQIIIILHARPHVSGGPSLEEADSSMRALWMSRCTAEEFANGHV